MKKKLTRLFSVLLAAVLVFGTLPVFAMGTDVADPPASAVDDTSVDVSAAEPEETTDEEPSAVDETPEEEDVETQSADLEAATVETVEAPALEDKPYNIFFLDCGRKYYSVDSIKQFIDNASAAGFNYIQLAVGNDGLRFLLDDMSVQSYTSDEVKTAIQNGNVAYNKSQTSYSYNLDVNELTQSQMDTIIDYANSKGMGVIPCVNTPGHMDAILSAANSLTGKTCSYNGSVRTIDVTNDTAVAFTQALLQKYINYFEGKGCEFFNMGADEYANDKYDSGSMGFGNLQSAGKYDSYITYVNTVAAMIKTAGMTPMAFNDGIYFNNNTSSGTIDTDIVVCYWSNGWTDYTPMSASNLASMGFRLINTNGAYYWVLGKSDAQCDKTKASGFDRTAFPGGTIDNPLGSMFCIWADYPGAETEADVISKTEATIAAFGAKLPKDEIVISDAANDTADGGKLTVGTSTVLVANKKVDWTTSNASVASIASADNDAVSTYSADAVNAKAITVTAEKAGSAKITATAGNKTATYTVTVNDPVSTTITVNVNGTETVTVDGNYPGPFTTGNTGIATVQTEVEKIDGKTTYESASLALGTFYVSASANDTAPSATLTFEDAGNGEYYIKDSDGNYIYPNATYNRNRWSCGKGTGKQPVTVSSSGTGTGIIISRDYESGAYANTTAYLNLEDGKFGAQRSVYYGSNPVFYLYTSKTTDPTYKTKITFTGVSVGETTVKIGDVTYKIVVEAEDLTKVTPLTIEYWITNARVKDAAGNSQMELEAVDAYSEAGKSITELVPVSAMKDTHEAVFLKATRLTSDKKQTTDNGVDRTTSGYDFSFVRYWNNQWGISKDGNEWVNVASTDQIVAYYLQKTKVTTEIDTNVTDWGEIYKDWVANGRNYHWFWTKYVEYAGKSYQNDSVHNFVFMDFAVVYEDSTQNPSSFPNDNTMFFHADEVTRHVGYINFDENENYEIWKVTVTDGTSSGNTSASSFTSSYNDETEKVVWDTSMGGEPHIEQIKYTAQKTGKLIRVYVRAKKTEDSLTVNYIDDTTGETFYHYNIAVNEGTVFPNNFAFDGTKNVIKNIKDVNQTVTNDLSQMSEIGAQYRYAAYEMTRFGLADENKTLNIHYNFTRVANFVIDFGTPLKISPSDIKDTLGNANITSVEVSGDNHGTAAIDEKYNVIYTPDARFASSEKGETLQITYKGTQITEEGTKDGKISYTVYIRPASNVLYEEDFLTGATGWTLNGTADSSAQQTQKVGDKDNQYNVFGFDGNYYAGSTGENGVWKAGDLDKNGRTKALTTEFYGNTFDLIGSCAADTGRVLLMITKKDGGTKLIDIDTRYNDGSVSQVPLAHVELGEDAEYSVEIYAAKLAAKTVTAPRGVATMALDASDAENDDLVTQILEENGLTLADVEYVSTSVMNGAAAVSEDANVPGDAVATYADTSITFQAGTHVEIDGFRVYRSTTDDVAKNYPDNEQNMNYKNILDMVGETITAYVEGGDVTDYSVNQYEAAGGPQNEIYLKKDQSVTVQIKNVDTIQVSLRAVDGVTEWNKNAITSNTELYYKLTKDDNGLFTITNTGDNLLAIGNVKVPATAGAVTTASDIDHDTLLESIQATYSAGTDEPEVFVPETFTAKTTSTPVIRNKVVTLKVNVSSDVAYITVNGVKYTRTGLQGLFQATRTIRVVNTVPKNQTKTYEVVAYNADGVASETITVTG